jgi:rod shape-determining protein MreD
MISQASWLAILFSFCIALVLELIRLPVAISEFRPEWLVLTMIYWTLRSPMTMGLGAAFFVGIILDVMAGTYLGINSLALCLVCYLAIGMHKRFKMFPIAQQAAVAFVLVLVHLVVVYTFSTLLSRAEDGWGIFLSACASAFFWPILVVLYDRLNMGLRL